MFYKLDGHAPKLNGAGHFIAPGAKLIGQVVLESQSSVWFNTVIRADNTLIHVGARSNIQDGAVLHSDPGFELVIGEDVTIGHNAMVHGCKIDDAVLIGIGATVLNGANIGRGSIIGANALVPENLVVPPYSLVVGVPAKIIKTFDETSAEMLQAAAQHYVDNAQRYQNDLEEINEY